MPHSATVAHPMRPTYPRSARTGSLDSNYSLASTSTALTVSPHSTPKESTPFEWDFWMKDSEEVDGNKGDAHLEPIESVVSPLHHSPSEQLSWAATWVQAEYVLGDGAQHFAQALGPAPHSNVIADSAIAKEFFKDILCLGISSSPPSFK